MYIIAWLSSRLAPYLDAGDDTYEFPGNIEVFVDER